MQFEYGPLWQHAGSTLSGAFRMLEGANYTVLLITQGALRAFPAQDMAELFTYANFVALRAPIVERLRPWVTAGW